MLCARLPGSAVCLRIRERDRGGGERERERERFSRFECSSVVANFSHPSLPLAARHLEKSNRDLIYCIIAGGGAVGGRRRSRREWNTLSSTKYTNVT